MRNHDEIYATPSPAYPNETIPYPWENQTVGGYPRIAKAFFRCNCGSHSLPLREGKEFVYPCLLDLLNYIQEKSEHRVVITCGHRCREHNTASDPSRFNWGSKHMLAAEVDFYVEGVTPQAVLKLISAYYDDEPFERYHREGMNISTPPWFNKEIFVKLYLPNEGRDGDNQHPHPYLGIQVRYDRDLGQRVTFDQKQVENYLRN